MGQAGALAGAGLEPQEGGHRIYSGAKRGPCYIYRPAAVKVLRMMRREMTAGKIVECATRLALAVFSVMSCLQHSHQAISAAKHLGAVDCGRQPPFSDAGVSSLFLLRLSLPALSMRHIQSCQSVYVCWCEAM